jgi:hypothetical protein
MVACRRKSPNKRRTGVRRTLAGHHLEGKHLFDISSRRGGGGSDTPLCESADVRYPRPLDTNTRSWSDASVTMTNTCSVRRSRGPARPGLVPDGLYVGYESPPLAVGGAGYVPGLAVGGFAGPTSRDGSEGRPLRTGQQPRRVGPSRAVVMRRRVVLAAVAVAMLVLLALPWGGTGGRSLATPGAARAGSLIPGTVYTVRPGDTLWGIAERIDGGSDMGPLVAQLESQIGGDALQPGEQLRLP